MLLYSTHSTVFALAQFAKESKEQKAIDEDIRMAERPEDLNLPGSIVSRIIKDALPDGTKVSKEAQQAIAKAASVFVLYATSCSNQVSLLNL